SQHATGADWRCDACAAMPASSSKVSMSSTVGGEIPSAAAKRVHHSVTSAGTSLMLRRIAEMAPIDHLMWVVPDLDTGIDELDRRTGERATLGGAHAGLG